VVVFRDQDFANLPIEEALTYCRYFGRLNVHPTTGSPAGFPEVHLAHRGAGDKTMEKIFGARTSSITWHSDTSFERQPAGTTFMYILEHPECGGDTIFSNNVEAYNRLSQPFATRLHGLQAVHSGIKLAESSRARGGIVRREPVHSVHPLVRTHPVTKEKALFVNPHCKRLLAPLVIWSVH
jgi:sulfonate dioxygenase